MKSTQRPMIVSLLCIAFWGCGAGESGNADGRVEPQAPLLERLGTLDEDLKLGATGPGVRAVNEYLEQSGYFPNADLAKRYPAWHPVVAPAPMDPATFDQQTEAALTALQAHMGLEVTGVVDGATREVLRQPRCGFPESATEELTEKFSFYNTPFSPHGAPTIRWKVMSAPQMQPASSTSDVARVAAVATAAFAVWSAQSNISFTQVTSSQTADIEIIAAATQTKIAQTEPLPGPAIHYVVKFDPEPNPRFFPGDRPATWSDQATTPMLSHDMLSTMIHELGHAIGLGHSGLKKAVMYPDAPGTGNQKRVLTIDDQYAVSSLYDLWEPVTGRVRDIDLGFTTTPPLFFQRYIWAIGETAAPGGFQVLFWNGSGWTVASGNQGGVRIAVGTNTPWIVDQNGNTFQRDSASPTSGNWVQVPGCATDIAAAPFTSFGVWKIDCAPAPDGYGGLLEKWNNSTRNWDSTGEGAARVAVDDRGRPYVTDIDGGVWRRQSENPSVMGWDEYPGACGLEIAVGSGRIPWIIGCEPAVGGNQILVWNEQERAIGVPDAPKLREWLDWSWDGGGNLLAIDETQQPWVVANDLSLWKVQK